MSQPNIIVLIFDTLRSDYLSCYGSDHETPNFDSVAAKGTLFESAFAGGPGTPISHAALYTGQYPSENGVTGPYIDLPDDRPVLAQWLHDHGYSTYGIAGPAKMGSDWRFDRGFEEFFETYKDIGPRPSKEYFKNTLTNPSYLEDFVRTMGSGGSGYTQLKFDLLEEKIRDGLDSPFFALANFLTAHIPYDPPRPYKEQFRDDFSRPRWFILEKLLDKKGYTDHQDIRLDRIFQLQTSDGIAKYLGDSSWLTDAEIQLLRDWYAASVRFADDMLGQFLEFYERELADDTILILTSDHGEQLGERGLWAHSHHLYDETLQVPLIVRGPGISAGERRCDPVSLIDLFDTICDICTLPSPDTTSGRSLFKGDHRDAVCMEYGVRDETFADEGVHAQYLDSDRFVSLAAGRKAIRTNEYKLVVTSEGDERLLELPTESEVTNPPSDVVSDLREQLFDSLPETYGVWPITEQREDVKISPGVEKNLQELGYID